MVIIQLPALFISFAKSYDYINYANMLIICILHLQRFAYKKYLWGILLFVLKKNAGNVQVFTNVDRFRALV
jgi:hypothetical protein